MKNQQVLILSLFLLLAVLFGAKAHAQSDNPSRFEVIGRLQTWYENTSKRKDLVEREKDLRLQLISRLIFQVERKYSENSLRHFLQVTLDDMTETDKLQKNQSFGAMPFFLENLSLSLKNLLEQNEKPLQLIQAFTEYSGISDPATMDEFAETRNYYDGKRTRPAKSMSLDQATAHLEEHEKLEEQKRQEQMKQIELLPTEGEWIDFREDLRQDFIPQNAMDPVVRLFRSVNTPVS